MRQWSNRGKVIPPSTNASLRTSHTQPTAFPPRTKQEPSILSCSSQLTTEFRNPSTTPQTKQSQLLGNTNHPINPLPPSVPTPLLHFPRQPNHP
ncbi:uncharacterized protein BO80DRAFT_214073 [Aspergillus ibericus CBS 121593]|uniref:Uncharacterized protein n=1 Tax=Aspergillus ibericus CBS 121593 TaxID=1448316 RepID=A0A395GS14_9EURO|nr:hypothetical protein BO80DRAFT_214073 [Aspergillus ibericus CBS 121593]RAK96873.1 hypothetical protein BO80DRAFT_214073 [Aspergillus ibericus CBS 121593]